MKKGFTLVELLVVLVIIGVLIGLILPNTLKAIKQANNKECASNLRSIDTALQLCYTETHDWNKCNSVDALVTGKYLETKPVCPFGVAYAVGDSDRGKSSVKTDHFAAWPPGSNGTISDHVQ